MQKIEFEKSKIFNKPKIQTKRHTEIIESLEKIIGEDPVSNSFRNHKTYQQQMRLADMESQLKNLKGQLTKTKKSAVGEN